MYMIPSSLLTVCRVSGPVGHWVNRFLIESRKLGLLSLSRFVPSEHKSHLQRLAQHGVIHLAPRILGLCSLLQWMLSGSYEVGQERRHPKCLTASCLNCSSERREMCIQLSPCRRRSGTGWVNAASRGYLLSFSISSFLLFPKEESLNNFLNNLMIARSILHSLFIKCEGKFRYASGTSV